MSENTILTYAERMTEDMRGAIELVCLPGNGAQAFQQSLIEAETAGADDIASLAQLISIAHAAFAVADAGIDSSFTPWYHDMGQRLLRRSMDALAVIEADREPRPVAGLN